MSSIFPPQSPKVFINVGAKAARSPHDQAHNKKNVCMNEIKDSYAHMSTARADALQSAFFAFLPSALAMLAKRTAEGASATAGVTRSER